MKSLISKAKNEHNKLLKLDPNHSAGLMDQKTFEDVFGKIERCLGGQSYIKQIAKQVRSDHSLIAQDGRFKLDKSLLTGALILN